MLINSYRRICGILVNIKFGELKHNPNWQTFSLAIRAILSDMHGFMMLHNTRDYK